MDLKDMFNQIKEYHHKLGYEYNYATVETRMEGIRLGGLALYQEVAELIDSFPWKHWRSINSQTWSPSNATQEIVDCIFFLGLIIEAAGIEPVELEYVFLEKMKENYDRIERGYNNKPEERG